MRRLGLVAALSLLLTLPAAPARAGHAVNCGILYNVSGTRDYRVRAVKVRCGFARKWSLAYLRHRQKPSGWRCTRPGTRISFYCQKGSSAYYAERP